MNFIDSLYINFIKKFIDSDFIIKNSVIALSQKRIQIATQAIV